MPEFGKVLVIAGLVLCGVGLALWTGILGKLPGDIHIQGKHVTFYFPIVTCIVLSVLLTLLLRIFGR